MRHKKKKKPLYITKASREQEEFNPKKFCRSLRRAGVPGRITHDVCRKIEKSLRPGTTTEDIYKKTFNLLLREHPGFAGRYSLKRSIMELGPSGFFFEQYLAAVLEEYGYAVKTNQWVPGRCSSRHEIDLIIEKGGKKYFVEAKYHNSPGIKSDIKVVMYTYARLLDIVEGNSHSDGEAWLFTNTKFTSKAKSYGKCRGVHLTGWRYPGKKSLESLIEKKKLYPVTILPSVTLNARQRLGEGGLFFAKDILNLSPGDLVKRFGLTYERARNVCDEAESFFSL